MAETPFAELPLSERLRLVFGSDEGAEGEADGLSGPPSVVPGEGPESGAGGLPRVPSFASCLPGVAGASGARRDSAEGPAGQRGTRRGDWALDEEGSEAGQSGVSSLAPVAGRRPGEVYVMKQPGLLTGGILKDYQLDSLQWLARIHTLSNACRKEHDCEINAILGDEMGLGKTIQSISILAFVKEVLREEGPHIVIVPKSTLAQWSQEFAKWCPDMKVITLLGGQEVRTRVMDEYLAPLYQQELEDRIQTLFPDNSDSNDYESDEEWIERGEPSQAVSDDSPLPSSATTGDEGGDESSGDSDDIPSARRAPAARAPRSPPVKGAKKTRSTPKKASASFSAETSESDIPIPKRATPKARTTPRAAKSPGKAAKTPKAAKPAKTSRTAKAGAKSAAKKPARKPAGAKKAASRRRAPSFITESSSEIFFTSDESGEPWASDASQASPRHPARRASQGPRSSKGPKAAGAAGASRASGAARRAGSSPAVPAVKRAAAAKAAAPSLTTEKAEDKEIPEVSRSSPSEEPSGAAPGEETSEAGPEDPEQQADQPVPSPNFDVLLTTYEQARMERKVLRAISWNYMVLDEGHRLKDSESKTFKTLKRFIVQHKVILTGTPIQNNLQELWAILNFLMPQIFQNPEEFMDIVRPNRSEAGANLDSDAVELQADSRHRKKGLLAAPPADKAEKAEKAERDEQTAAEQDAEAAARTFSVLHPILKHFLLRRNKAEVETLPPKHEFLIHCEMTPLQRRLYKSLLLKDLSVLETAVKGNADSELSARRIPQISLTNILVALRKCCDHPYLFEGVEPQPHRDGEHLIRVSGKMIMMDALLKRIRARGEKVLIFCQMTMLMDLLEDYLRFRAFGYYRLDGRSEVAERARAMRHFNDPRNQHGFVFLLSTRAGCLGLNLTAANNVIIIQQDFNPQADSQAVARAYRILQTKEVFVYRLLAADTVDEKIYERAQLKMQLDEMIIKRGDFSQNRGLTTFLKEKSVLRGGKKGMLEIIACSGKMLDDEGPDAQGEGEPAEPEGPALTEVDAEQAKNFGPIVTQERLERILEQGLQRTRETQEKLDASATAASSNLLHHLEEDGTLTNMKAEDLYSFEGQVYTKKRLQEIVQRMRQEKLAQAIRDGTARPEGAERADAQDWEEEQTTFRLDRYKACHTVYAAGYQLLPPRYYQLRDVVVDAIRNDYRPETHPAGINKPGPEPERKPSEPAPRRRKKPTWPDCMSPGLTAEEARELRSLCLPGCGCFGKTKSFNGLFYRFIRYSIIAYRPWEGPRARIVGRLRVGEGTTPEELNAGSNAVIPTWVNALRGDVSLKDTVLGGEEALEVQTPQTPAPPARAARGRSEYSSSSFSSESSEVSRKAAPPPPANWSLSTFLEGRQERYRALTTHHPRLTAEPVYPYEGFAKANSPVPADVLDGGEDWACVYFLFSRLHQEWLRVVNPQVQQADEMLDRPELDSDESYQDETVVRNWPGPHNQFCLAGLGGIPPEVRNSDFAEFSAREWYFGDGEDQDFFPDEAAGEEVPPSEPEPAYPNQAQPQALEPQKASRKARKRSPLPRGAVDMLDRCACEEGEGTLLEAYRRAKEGRGPHSAHHDVHHNSSAAQAEGKAPGHAGPSGSAGRAGNSESEASDSAHSAHASTSDSSPGKRAGGAPEPQPASASPGTLSFSSETGIRISRNLGRALLDTWLTSSDANDDRIERSVRACRVHLSSKEVETYGKALLERLRTNPELVVGGQEIMRAVERARACRKRYYGHVLLLRRYIDMFRYPLRDMPVPRLEGDQAGADAMEDRLLLFYADMFGLGRWRDIRMAMEQSPLGWGTLRPRRTEFEIAERLDALLERLGPLAQKVAEDRSLVERRLFADQSGPVSPLDVWMTSSYIFYPSRPCTARPARVDYPGLYYRFSYTGDILTGPQELLDGPQAGPGAKIEILSPAEMVRLLIPGRHSVLSRVFPSDALLTYCEGKVPRGKPAISAVASSVGAAAAAGPADADDPGDAEQSEDALSDFPDGPEGPESLESPADESGVDLPEDVKEEPAGGEEEE